MPKCSLCGDQIEKGTGVMFVFTSGKIDNYCSKKCEKNTQKLKRKPLQTAWTQEYRREHKKGVGSVGAHAGKKEE